jgi:uncharacterized protein YigA (DUF484 family)
MTAPIDSAAVAKYLAEHPHFFDEHAGLLGEVRLASPLTGRAVSLQERQMEVMRDKYKALELRMAGLVRLAEENAATANKFHRWTQAMLPVRTSAALPGVLLDSLKSNFDVPHATLRLWHVKSEYLNEWFAAGVSDDAKMFANSLQAPYCGSNHDFEAVRWLEAAATVASTVILPLRAPGPDASAFGLLILGSPDAQRFTAEMATDFLVHIGETTSVALAALQS